MRLLEHKGKELLKFSGIKVPPGIVTDNKSYINLSYHKERFREFFFENKPVIIKAQVISGKRKKSGLIVEALDYESALTAIDSMYKKQVNGSFIDTLLVEKKIEVKEEYFLSISYDTNTRKPMIIFSKKGGIDVEDHSKQNSSEFITTHVSPSEGLYDHVCRDIAKAAGFTKNNLLQVASFIKKAYDCFWNYDCKSLEINPVILTPDNVLYAGDAKIIIDENALSRHDVFSHIVDAEDKSFLNEREIEARKIDANDHRGVAGKTYIDLDGDIAVLASGGGASLTCMDALIEAGGKPANYTEYSGNPPREKVKKLTEITLSKPGLNGCLIIGGRANFTDVFETLSGFAEGLESLKNKPDYPIVIRRAGPNSKQAFDMLKKLSVEKNYDITLYGEEMPMTAAVRVMVEKSNAYKESIAVNGS
ncbi:MAG TPA: ATP-grasp domain-containing protein [Alphaproteobacteria bacterium]|nr:ATP-grasp domain-containing protein [Alphaproteobacteria bacterium]